MLYFSEKAGKIAAVFRWPPAAGTSAPDLRVVAPITCTLLRFLSALKITTTVSEPLSQACSSL